MENKKPVSPIYYNGPVVRVHCIDETGLEYIRQGTIKYLYLNDIAYIDATDKFDIEPRSFFVRQAIDWDAYLKGIGDCWLHGFSVPYQFKFYKKIHPDVMENFCLLPLKEKQMVLESLRHNGFLPKLKMLKNGNQPNGMDWGEVAGLCLKSVTQG